MKRIIILCLAITTFYTQAQNFSPAINRNLELIFVDYLMPYNSLYNIEPTTNPVDTFGYVEVLKNSKGAYIQGREFEAGNLIGEWKCSNAGSVNSVYLTNPSTGDTLQLDKIYRDTFGRDTLYQTYYDTTSLATGSLVLSEELRLYYGSNGVDSAAITEVNGGASLGNNINYTVYRNAQNRVDSLVANIEFMGTTFPVQTLIYFTSNNQLDSINLKNTLNGQVEEQVRVTNNNNGLVEKFLIYERGPNNTWTLYDEYHLSMNSYFSLPSEALAELKIFPNPSQGIINLNNSLNADISIRNMSGQIVWERENLDPDAQLNLKQLTKGLYMIQVKLSDNRMATEKLILN